MKRKRGRPSSKMLLNGFSARDQIVSTASRLFYERGFQNVSIDDIIKASSLSKMTFFKYFASKDEIISDSLMWRVGRFNNWFERTYKEQTDPKKNQVLRILDTIEIWYRHPKFRGCAFLNAIVELGPVAKKPSLTCEKHINSLLEYIKLAAKSSGYKNPKALAEQLLTAIHGANARAQFDSAEAAIRSLRMTSQSILKNYI